MLAQLKQFFASPEFGVVGASKDRHKFGNRVLRCYMTHHKIVYPVHPNEDTIEGLSCYKSLDDLPDEVLSISIITPPQLTEKIVEQAHLNGIRNIWMQPGAQSPLAVSRCLEHGINVIADGTCILVELGCHDG